MATDVALRESESRHRVLLEALPQLVWTGAGDGACEYFNPQGLHRPAQEHLGSKWLSVIHQQDRERLEATWRSALTTGVIFDADATAVPWWCLSLVQNAIDPGEFRE